MKFHVASRGVANNFDFPAGGGGVMFKSATCVFIDFLKRFKHNFEFIFIPV